ncbi:MAG TPA: flagellar hook capping FlgD N-terminal domain-containing protein [Bryobacteraceae bacterium]|nr:flagellar hook capping FlgD N-terminal domain-containing protein [Bryobacteraceae bacterium]
MSTVNNAVSGAAGATTGTSVAGAATTQLSKDTFLQLLVAQIKNQNPLNPADGAQFLAELAQFSQLEQSMAIRQEVEALGDALIAPSTSKPSADSSRKAN